MIKRTGVYTLYKRYGAFQARLILPTYDQEGFIKRNGAVLIEMAPGVGKQRWDWDQKINFALSIADITILLDSGHKEVECFHETDSGYKKFKVSHGKNDSFLVNLMAKDKKPLMVPFNANEWQVFMKLLVATLPKLIGW